MDLTTAIAGAQPAPAAYVIGPADYSYLYKGSARNLQERLRVVLPIRSPRQRSAAESLNQRRV